ncbi:MAG: DUF47 family protein [Bacteroidales bacterium]|jgi:predicted phosphate transport protein (TIGR00153 family)|nr:DUF47 family protein [Bacteroidales bacterium]
MNNTFFSKFTPKETKFFPLLNGLSDIIINVSNRFCLCVETKIKGLDITEEYEAINLEEKRGDKITTEIINELSRTFITPFDREDIHELANNLDDVIDEINSCTKKIFLYDPEKLTKEVSEFAIVLKKGAIQIKEAVNKLENLKNEHKSIAFCCEELHSLENEGDDLYAEFIKNIFRDEKNSVEIIKLKDIVAGLEKATDCADHVGKVIRTIIVKYA